MDPIVWDSFHTTKHTNTNTNTRFDMSFTLVCYFRTGCSLKIVFFPNLLQPISCMQEISSSDLRSECTVTLIGWPFFVQPIAAGALRGRGRKKFKILGEKTQYLMNTLYLTTVCACSCLGLFKKIKKNHLMCLHTLQISLTCCKHILP